MSGAREVLKFDDLTPYLMLKNGNYLYKVPFRDGCAILKVYYGSKGLWGNLTKSFGNVVMQGQPSYMPKTRCRIEHECIELWRKHGFRTFEVYDVELQAPGCVPGGYRLVEYVKAQELYEYMADDGVPADERFALYRRWLGEWSRRHDVAKVLEILDARKGDIRSGIGKRSAEVDISLTAVDTGAVNAVGADNDIVMAVTIYVASRTRRDAPSCVSLIAFYRPTRGGEQRINRKGIDSVRII